MSSRIAAGGALGAVVCSLLALGGGCLTRPVVGADPTTQTNFTIERTQTSIDKVDILFDIDNSASMGDKQAYLSAAIPDLISRLVTPNCVDAHGNVLGQSTIQGACTAGTVEFSPVHDMHIGIVSSSLGQRGGDANTCAPGTTTPIAGGGTIAAHNDDRGELLNRSSPLKGSTNVETRLAAAGQSNFLAWYPTENANLPGGLTPGAVATTDAANLQTDFEQMVEGVHQYGCGIESQLESWYRFLIQPDPYDSISTNGGKGPATWVGVDKTIIQQRHDFLRPDSLVVVIVLSDENDSEIDVRSLGGNGYNFMIGDGTFLPQMGASVCQNNPLDPGCKATSARYPADETNWAFNENLRHVHMLQKYGLDPQFPIQRYVLGLTSATVPDRNDEYPTTNSNYAGLDPKHQSCVNPLFGILPDGTDLSESTLCNLAPNPDRTSASNLVYYAHIGGVPHELLQEDPTMKDSPQKATLTSDDWVKILGNDPLKYDYTGIDPHMIESYQPRTASGVLPPGVSATGLSPPGSSNTSDPISGHEWITDGKDSTGVRLHFNLPVDREYACTFLLDTPRQCDPEGPAVAADPTISAACDCGSKGLTPAQLPAVCNQAKPTQQDYAKAYPTIRELLVAKLLGTHGIVSSLCPIHVAEATPGDPLYGYRPAIKAIVDRLATVLGHQCLPEKLTPDDDAGDLPCLVLATLTQSGQTDTTCTDGSISSLEAAPKDVLARFRNDQHAQWKDGGQVGVDPSTLPTCSVKQVFPAEFPPGTGSCATSTVEGWCYVENTASCAQALYFSPNGLPKGAQISLQCLESSPSLADTPANNGPTTVTVDM